jgi:hypothetical protein
MAGAFNNGVLQWGFDDISNSIASFVPMMQNNNGDFVSTNARYGDGQCFELGVANEVNGPAFGYSGYGTNLARVIEGVYAYYNGALPTSGFKAVRYWYDSTAGAIQLMLMVGSAGQLQFYLGNGTTPVGSASASGVFQPNRGSYITVDFTINSSSGIVKCYVDTSGSSPVISNTGVNSQSTANAYVSQPWFQNISSSNGLFTYFDDYYALDLSGSAPFNAVLGPIHLHYDPPNSDASPNQFSTNPSQTTGNHYKNVDSPLTQTTDYNYDDNPGDEENYGFPNITAAQVLTVAQRMYVELDASGARTVSPVLTSSGVQQVGTAFTPPSAYQYAYQISTIDPNTSNPWASGSVAAAQAAKLGIIVET